MNAENRIASPASEHERVEALLLIRVDVLNDLRECDGRRRMLERRLKAIELLLPMEPMSARPDICSTMPGPGKD